MYIIGNAETSAHVPMWYQVITLLENSDCIGHELQLKCPRHPAKKTFVKSPEDFEIKCPEGGCSEVCGLRLSCGHICGFKCHPKILHENSLCFQECPRPRDCGHPCRLKCKDACGDCMEAVYDVELPCGHVENRLSCYRTKDLSRYTCSQLVEKVIPDCGHTVQVHCFRSNEPDISCTEKCRSSLPCGHLCLRSCKECKISGEHAKCTTICGENYQLCGHKCPRVCHEGTDCPPCKQPCEIQCKHSRCPNKCGEACYLCAEECGWECEHQKKKCTMPCSVPCDKEPCNKRCEKKLSCKHRCPSVCGEACPSAKYCQECARPDIKKQRVDLITLESYDEIKLNEDPVIFLKCGHFYTMSSLDGTLELKKYYEVDRRAGTRRILMSGETLKGCPDCRRPLRNIDRYNRIFKSSLLDELTRRFMARSATEYAELLLKIKNFESGIEAERQSLLSEFGGEEPKQASKTLNSYKKKGRHIRTAIREFSLSVLATEQPLTKVNDLYLGALAKRASPEEGQSFHFDEAKIQTGFTYRGRCLEARAKWIILSDWQAIANHRMSPVSVKRSLRDSIDTEVDGGLKDTTTLIEDCHGAHLPAFEVEARVYHAYFSILKIQNSRARGVKVEEADEAAVRKKELKSLAKCENLCRTNPGTVGRLEEAVERAKRSVNGEVFYAKVTSDEEVMIVRAMAQDLSGSGHWYYCVNGHPFAIGDCGMPMQSARCPECGERIGGQNHDLAEGVRSATDFEERNNIGT
ncbi:hypothetical protein TWF481_009153 [Arthrobotrys musiformis]|uniref:RZ-type domain-containing protein n=1 Tax=Arthrobotrys musiformis TaxID=47236 RepID=A0AAV9W535_9PEZI